MNQKVATAVAVGIKYVRKANMWVFYKCFNNERATDVREWFGTEEEAKARLEKEQNGE
jgi:hypothetical protein